MALLDVVHMSAEQRDHRRENDEACFRRVEAEIGHGTARTQAFTRVASRAGMFRGDVVAAYWRHVRRSCPGTPPGGAQVAA